MKFMIALLSLSFALTSFAAAKTETKRDVAQAKFRIKLHSGTSSVHKLENEEPTFYVSVDGDAAKTLWSSLKSIKATDMGTSGAGSTDRWSEKIAPNLTCDRFYDVDEKTTSYSCSMMFVNGVAGGGGAG